MDWVSATYNKLEGLAIAADRFLGAVVERCEDWMAGRRAGAPVEAESNDGAEDAAPGRSRTRSGRPLSA
jgi:hypothetical protein